MMQKKYQTVFSEPNKAICTQLRSTTFLAELESVAYTRLFQQFHAGMTDEELRQLRDGITAVTFVTNLIREG